MPCLPTSLPTGRPVNQHQINADVHQERKIMIIEFPKKYDVRMVDGRAGALVELPAEYRAAAMELFNAQPWINEASPLLSSINVYISRAYEITTEQAHTALCRLCEHIMSPPVEVDPEVWGDALDEANK